MNSLGLLHALISGSNFAGLFLGQRRQVLHSFIISFIDRAVLKVWFRYALSSFSHHLSSLLSFLSIFSVGVLANMSLVFSFPFGTWILFLKQLQSLTCSSPACHLLLLSSCTHLAQHNHSNILCVCACFSPSSGYFQDICELKNNVED